MEWKLTTVDPQERSTWRSGVRSASNLEEGRLMWMMHLLVNQKSEYDIWWLSCLLTFFKINYFLKFFQEHYQSVKWLWSRSGPTFCWSWSGSKLFAKVTSIHQNTQLAVMLARVKTPTTCFQNGNKRCEGYKVVVVHILLRASWTSSQIWIEGMKNIYYIGYFYYMKKPSIVLYWMLEWKVWIGLVHWILVWKVCIRICLEN